jgi:hypothetical protein
MKFNPGDKVVLVREDHWSEKDQLKIGQIYTVRVDDGFNIKVLESVTGYYLNYNQFKKVVTTVDIGAKVVRGKDWEWGIQDKNSIYGIIEQTGGSGWAKTTWYSKEGNKLSTNSYKIGADDKYDLYYYDGAEIVTTEPVFVPPIVAKPELLVFDKYKIGDVVVSLTDFHLRRKEGEMFVVLPKSTKSCLYYKDDANNSFSSDWRAATEYEAAAFKRGITNINEIMPEPSLAFGTVVPKSEPKRDELVKEMQKFIPGYHLGCTLEVVSLPDIKGNTRVGSRFVSNPSEEWLEHMLDEFIKRTPTCAPDPLNTFGANYLPENLKVVFEDTTPAEVSQKSEPMTEDIPYKELEGKFVKCKSYSVCKDYISGKYYYVKKRDKYSITIVDRLGAFTWATDSNDPVYNVYDLSKGYSLSELSASDIDYDALKHVEKTIPKHELLFGVPVTDGSDVLDQIGKPYKPDTCYQIPGLFVGELNLHLPDTSITVVRPTSTKHKPDASFQVAFVDTQLRKPGKKTKIKF